MLKRPDMFTDKFYESPTLIEKQKIEIKETKSTEGKSAEGKEEKKAESIETYLKELYKNTEPGYYHDWKLSLPRDNEMKNFRGEYKNSEKPEEGYLISPAPEFEELKRQTIELVDQIKKWCLKNKIPPGGCERFDQFASNIFHPSYMNDKNAAEMYTLGKKSLEKIAFELHKENANKVDAERAILGLYPKLAVCAPGVATDLYLTTLEFGSSREEKLLTARTNLANQLALELIRHRYPPVRQGMEIHFVNALCNYVASELKIATIVDEYAAKTDLETNELESFLSLVKSDKFNELLIDAIVDDYISKIQILPEYESKDLKVFMKKLDVMGPFKNDKVTNFFEEKKDQETTTTFLPKKTSELRLALKESIMTRLINEKLINENHYLQKPLDDEKCDIVTFSNSPTRKDLTEMKTPFAYGILNPNVDFIVSSVFPRKITGEMKGPYSYVIFEHNLYFITKDPSTCTPILITDQNDNPKDYKIHTAHLDTIKKQLGKADYKLDQDKKWEYITRNLETDTLNLIAQTCDHPLWKIYYLQKEPPGILTLDPKNIQDLLQIPKPENHVCDEKTLETIKALTGHSHKETLYIDAFSIENSFVQRRMTIEQEKDKELFTEFFKKLNQRQQMEMLTLLCSKEVNVDIRFIFHAAHYVKPETVLLMAEHKEGDLSTYTYLLALAQENSLALRKILIEQQELKGSEVLSNKDILTQSLSSSMADAFWSIQKKIPSSVTCTNKIFIKSYQAGNRDFSGVDFGEMDFNEIKTEEDKLQNLCLNFSKTNIRSIKNFSKLFNRDTVKRIKLDGTKINGEQFQSLYNLGLRNFSGVDLSGVNLEKLNLSGEMDLILDNVDLRGATINRLFFDNLKSQTKLRLDPQQINLVIQYPPKQSYRSGSMRTHHIDLRNLNLEGINFEDVPLKINTSKIRYAIDFTGSNFKNANFHKVEFNKRDLQVNLNYCNFENANLSEAILTYSKGCNYKGAKFSNAELHFYTKLFIDEIKSTRDLTILDRNGFYGIIYNSKLKFGNNFRGVIIIADSLDTKPIKVDGIMLGEHGFKKLLEQGQKNFCGIKLSNVDLSNLDLSGVDFSKAELNNVNFTNSILTNTTFKNVKKMNACNLTNTIYKDLPLEYIKLVDQSKTPISICLSLLKEYAGLNNFIYSSNNDKVFVKAVKEIFSKPLTYSSVSDISDRLEQLANKTITSKDALLRQIFNVCNTIEVSAQKEKEHKKKPQKTKGMGVSS